MVAPVGAVVSRRRRRCLYAPRRLGGGRLLAAPGFGVLAALGAYAVSVNHVTRRWGRHGPARAAAATLALLLVAVLALALGIRGSDGPPQPVVAAAAARTTPSVSADPGSSVSSPGTQAVPGPAADKSSTGKKKASKPRIGKLLPASNPVALEIPSIGLRSVNFVDLEVAEDGTLKVPGSADEVGFYTGGPTPGQLGSAVLGAHVDSKEGPGIFYNLGAVKPGDEVYVSRQDRSRLTFVVDKVEVYPKDDFPTEAVYYGDFDQAEIRLVTCGGPFDRVKHYLNNVVVFGHLLT